jgi:DNA-binding NarL/FixJ family response regulator
MLRILLVDVHEIVRHGLRAVIEQHPDWAVSGEASSGREAVKLALKTAPDLVVLDVLLPELNGVEVTRAIKRELPNTEVLIFTVHDSEDLLRDVLAAGARGYVLKTDFVRNVVAAIESLAEHNSFFSGQISKKLLNHYIEAQVASAPSANELTAREREIMQLVAEGHGNKSTSKLLGISVKTTETHRASVMQKLALRSVAELVRYAIRTNVTEASP